MPIYEYACSKCGEEFEVTQRITEDPLTEHEACGGDVKRLISRSNFSLRGEGWYSDHYGLKGKADQKSDTDSTTKPATTDGKKTDTKPAKSGSGGDSSSGSGSSSSGSGGTPNTGSSGSGGSGTSASAA